MKNDQKCWFRCSSGIIFPLAAAFQLVAGFACLPYPSALIAVREWFACRVDEAVALPPSMLLLLEMVHVVLRSFFARLGKSSVSW